MYHSNPSRLYGQLLNAKLIINFQPYLSRIEERAKSFHFFENVNRSVSEIFLTLVIRLLPLLSFIPRNHTPPGSAEQRTQFLYLKPYTSWLPTNILPCHCNLCNIASKGNKTSQMGPIGGSLIFAFPLIVLHVYYITLQTYV